MEDDTPSVAEALMSLTETVTAPVQSAALGYRFTLISAGIGAEAADTMTADMHRLMCRMLGNEVQGSDE